MRASMVIVLSMILLGTASAQNTFHDFVVTDIEGKEFPLSQLKGKKVLVVNTASECGLTYQYKGLQELYDSYKDKNFVIIGFPSNDFGKQEPGSDEEIAKFCDSKYGVTFPMMSKIAVKGEDKHPLYQWLTQKEENGLRNSKVMWNFQKYMIDEEGRLIGHVPPQKKPNTRKIVKWINQ